jgi:hypothetical protein
VAFRGTKDVAVCTTGLVTVPRKAAGRSLPSCTISFKRCLLPVVGMGVASSAEWFRRWCAARRSALAHTELHLRHGKKCSRVMCADIAAMVGATAKHCAHLIWDTTAAG